KSIIVLIMCLYFLESEQSVVEFENTIILSSLALMLVGLYRYRTVGGIAGRLKSVGMLADPNDLSTVIVMAVPLALVKAFGRKTHLINQVMGLLFTGFSGLIIWFTRSRGAIVAVLAQLFTIHFAWVSREKRFLSVLVAAVMGVGGVSIIKALP